MVPLFFVGWGIKQLKKMKYPDGKRFDKDPIWKDVFRSDQCFLETNKKGVCFPKLASTKYKDPFWGTTSPKFGNPNDITARKDEDNLNTNPALSMTCSGQHWDHKKLECCDYDGDSIPLTAKPVFKMKASRDFAAIVRMVQRFRAILCGEASNVPAVEELGEQWGASAAADAASSVVNTVADTTTAAANSMASGAKDATKAVRSLAVRGAAKLFRALVPRLLRTKIMFMCESTKFSFSADEPTMYYLKKDHMIMGEDASSNFTLSVRKLSKDKKAGKLATKDSVHEEWQPSSVPEADRAICEAEATVLINRCSTCCCKDGMVNMAISVALTYKTEGTPSQNLLGTRCGSWFTDVDTSVRVIFGIIRAGQINIWMGPACFTYGMNPSTETIISHDTTASSQIKNACESKGCKALPDKARGCK